LEAKEGGTHSHFSNFNIGYEALWVLQLKISLNKNIHNVDIPRHFVLADMSKLFMSFKTIDHFPIRINKYFPGRQQGALVDKFCTKRGE
jgi:hypothetical protein